MNNNMIDKDDLISSANAIEDMKYMLQELQENFFRKFDSDNTDDTYKILYEFKRYRAFVDVIERLCFSVDTNFRKYDIEAFG